MKIEMIKMVIIKNIFKDDICTSFAFTRRPTSNINFRFTQNRSLEFLSNLRE